MKNENISEALALAICIQIKDDYDSLMRQVGLHERINPNNYHKCGSWVNSALIENKTALSLQGKLIGAYSKYIKHLQGTYFNGKEEAS